MCSDFEKKDKLLDFDSSSYSPITEVKRKTYREFENDDDFGTFGTLAEIQKWMEQNDVPITAELVYDGCGTHNIAFRWEVEIPYEVAAERTRLAREKEEAIAAEQRSRGLIA